jgi:hypothetical protein
VPGVLNGWLAVSYSVLEAHWTVALKGLAYGGLDVKADGLLSHQGSLPGAATQPGQVTCVNASLSGGRKCAAASTSGDRVASSGLTRGAG